jgi:hypothetical protein
MPNTYEVISSVTVGSGGAANIQFTSIPQTFTDLIVKLSGRSTASDLSDNLNFRINGNTSSVYSERLLYGTGSAAGSTTYSGTESLLQHENANTSTANTFANIEFYFPNYTSSNNKSVSVDAVTENNGTYAAARFNAVLFSNTSAITSLTFYPNTGNFMQYSTAVLYGIKNS